MIFLVDTTFFSSAPTAEFGDGLWGYCETITQTILSCTVQPYSRLDSKNLSPFYTMGFLCPFYTMSYQIAFALRTLIQWKNAFFESLEVLWIYASVFNFCWCFVISASVFNFCKCFVISASALSL